jgi:molecular chaperone DnaJ
MKDYYSILGIEHNADETLIKSRYRNLASIYHPDKNPDNQDKFLDINEAYKTLINPVLRDIYDKDLKEYVEFKKTLPENKITPFRSRLRDGGNINIEIDFTMDIKALKNRNGGKPETGEFIEKTLNIERYAKCPACLGEGKDKGTVAIPCSICRGGGAVKNRGTNINEACGNCGGYGDIFLYKCKTFNGKARIKSSEEMKLNFAIDELLGGKKNIVFEGNGDAGVFGGKNGNLNIFVKIDEDVSSKMNNDGKRFFRGLLFSKRNK